MRRYPVRCAVVLAAACTLAATGLAAVPGQATANSRQISIIQDGSDFYNAGGALSQFRMLGANTVRVYMPWATIAPSYYARRKPKFNATDPSAYPPNAWNPYDATVRAAQQYGLQVDLMVTGGAPLWATGPGLPKGGANRYFAWRPNAADFGQFVQAVGTRYSGRFKVDGSTLPAVHFWSIYNEPNFGEDLGPQSIDRARVLLAPIMFRGLLNAGWQALHASGHGRDTIIWGEFAARGHDGPPRRGAPNGYPGNYGQSKPLIFIRALYCLDNNYRPLRGGAARAEGCPTGAAGSQRFRRANPALFSASGVSDHPYPLTGSPVTDGRGDPNYATFPGLGNFGRALDRANRAYGSRTHFSIYNTEYGYITNPPHRGYPSPTTSAYYMNWAEYLSWKNPRIKSYMQYLLQDPPPNAGPYAQFASGLKTYTGKPKLTYYAYRMPFYMPRTNLRRGQNAEVWGGVRPAPFARMDGFGLQQVRIQELIGKRWTTLRTVPTGWGGYFDAHMRFSRSGLVRTQWTYPSDPFLPLGYQGIAISGRSFRVNVR